MASLIDRHLKGSLNHKSTLKGTIQSKGVLQGVVNSKASLTGFVSISTIIKDDTSTYLLVDENGNEIPAVLVDEPVTLTATANDIRLGTTAVTGDGVIEGTKEIPSYITESGYKLIPNNSDYKITNVDKYNYTNLLAMICIWNIKASDSVAVEKVVIYDTVYPVNSTEKLAMVTCDANTKTINLGLKNESGSLRIIRYITYKEVP